MDRRQEGLSARQQAVLDFIEQTLAAKGYPPTVREICEGLGVSSTATVHAHLARLEQKGYIRRNPTKPRAIEVVTGWRRGSTRRVVYVPVLAQVRANGQPTAKDVTGYLPLPADWVRPDPADHFFVTIRGDAMARVGILDGDRVLVRRQAEAEDGDIVLIFLEGEAACRRFYREGDHIRLEPANKFMESIRVSEVQIVGKVTAVVRGIK